VALVQEALALYRGTKVWSAILRREPIHGQEMLDEPGPVGSIVDRGDVLDLVAIGAEGQETCQPLAASSCVVLPDLVAMQAPLGAADLATVVGLAVDGSSQVIPLGWGKKIGQAGQAGAGWDGFDGEAKQGHD
jgi:hypothetical protein